VGTQAGYGGAGEENSALGYQALAVNSEGSGDTAVGWRALRNSYNGLSNTAVGSAALYANNSGNDNTAAGAGALFSSTLGSENTAVGQNALYSATTGSNNIALGTDAGINVTTGSNDIEIGNPGVGKDSGTIRIGSPGTHTAAYISGITSAKVTGSAVYVTADGQLGVLASSERYKTAVASMGESTGKLKDLRPVTFRLKTDPEGVPQYGLIAEEVAKVYPELVIRDERGKIEGVRYEELAPMLLNEVQRQADEIHAMQAQIAELKALEQARQNGGGPNY
jgi:hypothetical protein